MSMGASELKDILEKHDKWSRGEAEGQRADLRGAYLRGAYLQHADLRVDLPKYKIVSSFEHREAFT